jgi:hypothetical protein
LLIVSNLRKRALWIAFGLLLAFDAATLYLNSSQMRPIAKIVVFTPQTHGFIADFTNYGPEFKYACLTSAEYEQIFLPKQHQCYDCKLDDRSKELIDEGHKHDSILLAVRVGNTFQVSRVFPKMDLEMEQPVFTAYNSIAFYPEDVLPMTQCTSQIKAFGACKQRYRECYLLFENLDP